MRKAAPESGAVFLFSRAKARHYTPPNPKKTGKKSLKRKKLLKGIDKCWGGGGYNGCTT